MANSIDIDEINFIKQHLDLTGSYPFFVETGTFIGITTNNMIPHFERVRSVELQDKHYQFCCNRQKEEQWPNVDLYLGDSSVMLPKILEGLNENIIFYLDGHRCDTDFDSRYKDCPLMEELIIIRDSRQSYRDLIIIDDFRLFGIEIGWKDIALEGVKKIFEGIQKRYLEYNDRLIIV